MLNVYDVEALKVFYGKDVGQWLYDEMQKAIAEIDDPCVDNERIAEVGSQLQESNYDAAVEDGCCGFYDNEIVHPLTQRRFKIGFNYGH